MVCVRVRAHVRMHFYDMSLWPMVQGTPCNPHVRTVHAAGGEGEKNKQNQKKKKFINTFESGHLRIGSVVRASDRDETIFCMQNVTHV